jgi:hypothetical protein
MDLGGDDLGRPAPGSAPDRLAHAALDLATERPVPGVHAQTPAGKITFGFSPDLNAAMGDALKAMLTWLRACYGAGKAAALALASPVPDLRITQAANQSWAFMRCSRQARSPDSTAGRRIHPAGVTAARHDAQRLICAVAAHAPDRK